MSQTLREILQRTEAWPKEAQDDLVEYVRAIEARRTGVYHASEEELAAIDEAIGQVERGETASVKEVDAAFATFRGK
jgi:hypothetical protein